ncbi:MAG: hypothetical protein J6X88_03325 [Bacteroidales bacterium]|nr:hypothetical protein [Bacteroidales bacterium]
MKRRTNEGAAKERQGRAYPAAGKGQHDNGGTALRQLGRGITTTGKRHHDDGERDKN